MNADEATALAAALLGHGLLYVDYRGDRSATVRAYFSRDQGHGHELAAQALGDAWHRLGNCSEPPVAAAWRELQQRSRRHVGRLLVVQRASGRPIEETRR